jgi:hypothetical protein
MIRANDRLCECENEHSGSVITGNIFTGLQGEGTKLSLGVQKNVTSGKDKENKQDMCRIL